MTAAIRMIAEGCSAFSLVEVFRISESLLLESIKESAKCVVECFEDDLLRRPNVEEVKEIECRYPSLGFPENIGCEECAGWSWDQCLIAWKGLYRLK